MDNVDELPDAAQRRNSAVFIANTALYFLVAPVFYVGVLHAAILDSLGVDRMTANLPETAFLWASALPVVIAWLLPSPSLLRPLLSTSLTINGMGGLCLAGMCLWAPRSWLVPAIIAHAGLVGICGGIRNICLWELFGRGLSVKRRATTLGWTFGLGPILAVAGSCLSQLILAGNFLDLIHTTPVPRPWNYAILFGATAPAMWVAAALTRFAQVPQIAHTTQCVSLREIGRGLREYFWHPPLALAALGFLLIYCGTPPVLVNLALYAKETMGAPVEAYAGLQLALRFGGKCVAGFLLGWLVAKTHAKSGLLLTCGCCLVGVVWAYLVPGKWYLVSFGWLGAGDLFYVYFLNYIVGCSAPHRIRENTAYTNLLTIAVGFMPLIYAAIADGLGLRASFLLAAGLFVAAMFIVAVMLPRQPVTASSFGPEKPC